MKYAIIIKYVKREEPELYAIVDSMESAQYFARRFAVRNDVERVDIGEVKAIYPMIDSESVN